MYFNSFKQKDSLKVQQRNYFIDFILFKKRKTKQNENQHGFKIQEQYPINKVLSLCTWFSVVQRAYRFKWTS